MLLFVGIFPEEVKELDLTVLHYFIIEKILGIPGKEQRASQNIAFDRSFSDCLTKVLKDEVQMAIITQEVFYRRGKTCLPQVAILCRKSLPTFIPKVICGFLFSSIKEEEFRLPEYSPFLKNYD